MSLYAFDGTWNGEREKTLKEENLSENSKTNVVFIKNLYAQIYGEDFIKYWSGPGTRRGFTGKIFGGVFGSGGMKRVKRAIKETEERFKKGDTVIDVVGYSRGAAIALEFAHRVTLKIFQLPDGTRVQPKVRFLGLFDCVPAFGFPGNAINIGWKLCLPPHGGVRYCAHAMALDERREAFRVRRVIAKDPSTQVYEVWFRGAHGDIGGGNGNPGRYAISKLWMIQQAMTHAGWDVPDVNLRNVESEIDVMARVNQDAKDFRLDPFRPLKPEDHFHQTLNGPAPSSEKPLASLPDNAPFTG
jgi:uncharacterized protein (DUF2235 family)